MKYNELLEKLKKDLKPFIVQLIKEENDPTKKFEQAKQSLKMDLAWRKRDNAY